MRLTINYPINMVSPLLIICIRFYQCVCGKATTCCHSNCCQHVEVIAPDPRLPIDDGPQWWLQIWLDKHRQTRLKDGEKLKIPKSLRSSSITFHVWTKCTNQLKWPRPQHSASSRPLAFSWPLAQADGVVQGPFCDAMTSASSSWLRIG